MHPNERTNNTLKLSTPDDTYTTEETINQLKALTEKLCLVKDRITIDHAIIEIRSAANEIDILRVWCKGVEADNTTYRNLYNATLQQRDEARRECCRHMAHGVISAEDYAKYLNWDCFKEDKR